MANPTGATIPFAGAGVTDSGPNDHMVLNTRLDSKQVKLNSRNFSQATGDSIGFQSKVNQDTTTTGEVYGGQIQPRIASAISAATCNSLQLDSELKGTGATTVTGDLRNLNTYLGAANANHVIGQDAVTIRSRCEISTNPSGSITWAKILNHEGTQAWDSLFMFVSSADGNTSVANHDMMRSPGSGAAYAEIPVTVKGVGLKYIRIYDAS